MALIIDFEIGIYIVCMSAKVLKRKKERRFTRISNRVFNPSYIIPCKSPRKKRRVFVRKRFTYTIQFTRLPIAYYPTLLTRTTSYRTKIVQIAVAVVFRSFPDVYIRCYHLVGRLSERKKKTKVKMYKCS